MSKLLGGSRGPETAHYKFYELEAAEVVDIILDDTHSEYKSGLDIGKIKGEDEMGNELYREQC